MMAALHLSLLIIFISISIIFGGSESRSDRLYYQFSEGGGGVHSPAFVSPHLQHNIHQHAHLHHIVAQSRQRNGQLVNLEADHRRHSFLQNERYISSTIEKKQKSNLDDVFKTQAMPKSVLKFNMAIMDKGVNDVLIGSQERLTNAFERKTDEDLQRFTNMEEQTKKNIKTIVHNDVLLPFLKMYVNAVSFAWNFQRRNMARENHVGMYTNYIVLWVCGIQFDIFFVQNKIALDAIDKYVFDEHNGVPVLHRKPNVVHEGQISKNLFVKFFSFLKHHMNKIILNLGVKLVLNKNFDRSIKNNAKNWGKQSHELNKKICQMTGKVLPECWNAEIQKMLDDGDNFLIKKLQQIGKKLYETAMRSAAKEYGIEVDPDHEFYPHFKLWEIDPSVKKGMRDSQLNAREEEGDVYDESWYYDAYRRRNR